MEKNLIVVLDGFTLNPGDLSWGGLETIGDTIVHDYTPPEKTIGRSRGAQVLLTNKTVLDREVIEALPDLRYIGVMATGYNVVNLECCSRRGIVVTNVPEYGTHSVAQMTFALLLELTQHVGHHSRTVHEGRWTSNRDFSYWDRPLVELHGLTMGIVGYGRIGREVARIARAFGMNLLVHDPGITEPESDGIELTSKERVFTESDVVSLHCPLTTHNHHLVNGTLLNLMKARAFLINTGRGPLVSEPDLAEALSHGRIAGAAVDVLSTEPPEPDNPLLGAPNCIITPHIAWATTAARKRLMDTVVDNVRAFLQGSPVNVVNRQ